MFNEKQIRYVRRQITNSFYIMSESKETRFPASMEPHKSIQFPKVNFWNSVMVEEHFFYLLHSSTVKRTYIKQMKLLKVVHWTLISRQSSTVNVANINFKIKFFFDLLSLIFRYFVARKKKKKKPQNSLAWYDTLLNWCGETSLPPSIPSLDNSLFCLKGKRYMFLKRSTWFL